MPIFVIYTPNYQSTRHFCHSARLFSIPKKNEVTRNVSPGVPVKKNEFLVGAETLRNEFQRALTSSVDT